MHICFRLMSQTVLAALILVAASDRIISAAPGDVVTEDEAKRFGESVEKAIKKGDASGFTALIDYDAILDKATAGIQSSKQFQVGFRQGVKAGLDKPPSIGAQLCLDVKNGGSYQLLRTRLRGNQRTALLRIVSPDSGGMDYHEFMLGRGVDGKVRAVDMYLYMTAELFSESLRRPYLQAAASDQRGLVERLLGTEQDFVKHAFKLNDIADLLVAGKNREALDVYYQLPLSLQNDKTFLLLRLQATQRLDDKLYVATIKRFQDLFPKNAAIDMISIDGLILSKHYHEAIAAIDRLDKSLGGDPYLNMLRAGVYFASGEKDKARKAAEAAVQGNPDMIDCYWTLVGINREQNDYPGLLKALKQIDNHFNIEFNDLTTDPDYAGFVKSPQFEEWKSYLARKKEEQAASKKEAAP